MNIEEVLGIDNSKNEELSSISFIDTKTKLEPAWKRIQNGDLTASSDFLKDMEKTIESSISNFAGKDSSYKTQARILAIDAAKTFDPTKGADIKTHVFNNLKRLQRLSAQRGNLTRVPEGVALQRLSIQRAIREFEAEKGETPTTEQLADIVGMSTKRIDSIMNYKPVVSDSLAVNPEGDSMAASKVDDALSLYDQYIYNELDTTDKKIYEWATGYGKGEKLSGVEMGKRLNMTPAAVSKRYANIAQKFATDREMIRRSFMHD